MFLFFQHYFPCEIHKLSLRGLRRSKLTYFPIIVKKKGSYRGYFIFEIAHLRLVRDFERISQPWVPLLKRGVEGTLEGEKGGIFFNLKSLPTGRQVKFEIGNLSEDSLDLADQIIGARFCDSGFNPISGFSLSFQKDRAIDLRGLGFDSSL